MTDYYTEHESKDELLAEPDESKAECTGCGDQFDKKEMLKIIVEIENKNPTAHFFCEVCKDDLNECVEDMERLHIGQGKMIFKIESQLV